MTEAAVAHDGMQDEIDRLLDWYEARKAASIPHDDRVHRMRVHVAANNRCRLKHSLPPPRRMSELTVKTASQIRAERKAAKGKVHTPRNISTISTR